jgi:hypothetical protein
MQALPARFCPSLARRARLHRKMFFTLSGLLFLLIGHTMAIKIIVSDTVSFKVKGSINDEKGIPQPFHFNLTCVRLNSDQVQEKLKSETEASFTDFMVDVVEDWSGVRDADDNVLPYNESNLRQLLRISGLARLTFQTYFAESGAKEKN